MLTSLCVSTCLLSTSAFAFGATVTWIAGDGDWSNPANWDTMTVPDFDDDVIIDVSGETITVTISGAFVTVRSLTCTHNLDVVVGELTLRAASAISGALSITQGSFGVIVDDMDALDASLTLSGSIGGDGILLLRNGGQAVFAGLTGVAETHIQVGAGSTLTALDLTAFTDGLLHLAGGVLNAPQLANVDGSRFWVQGGSALALPLVTSYTFTANETEVLWAGGSGSALSFPNLTELILPEAFHPRHVFVSDGGSIAMPALTALGSDATHLQIQSSDGFIDFSSVESLENALLTVIDGGTIDLSSLVQHEALLVNEQGGTILANALPSLEGATIRYWGNGFATPNVVTIDGADLTLESGVTLEFPLVTTAVNTTLTMNGGTFQAPSLTAFRDGVLRLYDAGVTFDAPVADFDRTEIDVRGGMQFAPMITSYEAPASGNFLYVLGAGSVLQFPNLVNFDAGGATVFLSASDQATLVMDALTTLSPSNLLVVSATNATVSLASLTSAPRVQWSTLGGLINVPQLTAFTEGLVDISNGGAINAVAVTSAHGTQFFLHNNTTWNLPLLETITDCDLTLALDFNLTLPAVSTIQGTEVSVHSGATFNAANLTEFLDGSITLHDASTVSTPALVRLDGSSVLAYNGSITIPISTLDAAPGTVLFASGPGGIVHFPNLMSIHFDDSKGIMSVIADNGGQIDMPALTTLTGGSASFQASGPGSAIYILNLATFDPLQTTFQELNFGIIALEFPDDSDGDGLPDRDERDIYGTDPTLVDTDGDGMGDGFEIAFGLDPLDPLDAGLDPDDDTFTNLEEFLMRSDPADSNRPYRAFYAAPGGEDVPQGGTKANPWQTIAYAHSQIAATTSDDFILVLQPGVYAENVTLRARGILAGSLSGTAVIEGSGPVAVTGAQSARLRNLTIRAGASGGTLLRMANTGVSVDRVAFSGGGFENVTGIVTLGNAPSGAVITDSQFDQLAIGIEVFGASPTIRRSVFGAMGLHAIALRNGVKAQLKDGTLGGTNAGAGFNTFGDTGGAVVLNERDEPVDLRNNDWSTDNGAEIAAAIQGAAQFEPFVPAGKALLAATLVVTVWDRESLVPLTNASVKAGVQTAGSDARGVYLFASLPAGSYTVTAGAEGYGPFSRAMSLAEGALVNVSVALPPTDKGLDSDGDGLPDLDEILLYGTDPFNPDTSGNGLIDSLEVAYGLIQRIEQSPADLNGDGVVDAVDIQLVINGALGLPLPPEVNADINRSGAVDAVDVQIIINIVLGVLGR